MRKVLMLALVPAVLAAQNFDTITVKATALQGGVYVITGSGGNIGLSTGKDMAFLVDDQYAPLTPKLLATIAGVTQQPLKFVINTHWHFDHTGGNENVGKTGAMLVAHDNVRKRLATGGLIEYFKRTDPPAAPGALPIVTFTDSATFHVNDEEIVVFHVSPAHTDGDAIVHFTKANVVHMGDTFVVGRYPFVDLSSGGNINGVVEAADRVLSFCNADMKIIPGHGASVSDCAYLKGYRDMIVTVRERVRAAMKDNKSFDAIKAMKLTAEFDATHQGTMSPDDFVGFIHRSLGGKP